MKKPNTIQTVLSVASCKLTRGVLRRTGRGGTALPGIVAMKISKNILTVPAQDMEIVVVTGTNGKTTTCNMIEHALTENGHDCHRDKSGANLLHGIASDLICDTNWLGKPKNRYAVLEVDEAALKQVVPLIRPKVIVVTNLFTDQADRFGGVENTRKEILKGIKRSPDSVLVLNAEDTQSASLALGVPNKVIYYGLEETVGVQGKIDLADAGKCPKCGGEYEYDYHIYAHLGGFRCKKCDYQHRTPDVAVTSIDSMGTNGSTFRLLTGGQTEEVFVSLPAVYNVYNAAAVFSGKSGIEHTVAPTGGEQKPDIIMRLVRDYGSSKAFKLTYIFDAKYRLDDETVVDGVGAPPADAINQLHRYRDAIYYGEIKGGALDDADIKKEVIGGYILFPGSGTEAEIKETTLYKSISKVNIGALSLRPGYETGRKFLCEFIKGLVSKSTEDHLVGTKSQATKGTEMIQEDMADPTNVVQIIRYKKGLTKEVIQSEKICPCEVCICQHPERIKLLVFPHVGAGDAFVVKGRYNGPIDLKQFKEDHTAFSGLDLLTDKVYFWAVEPLA